MVVSRNPVIQVPSPVRWDERQVGRSRPCRDAYPDVPTGMKSLMGHQVGGVVLRTCRPWVLSLIRDGGRGYRRA